MMPTEQSDNFGDIDDDETGTISGRWVVIAMFAFAAHDRWLDVAIHRSPNGPVSPVTSRARARI